MPKGRGFLVRQPLHRLRRIDVLHDFPKREFPLVQRYMRIVSYFCAMRGKIVLLQPVEGFGGRALYLHS